jgi:hypothetical protein
MSGKAIKNKAQALDVVAGSHYDTLKKLIVDGFFDKPVTTKEVAKRVSEKSGSRLKSNHAQTYIKKFLSEDILHGVKPSGKRTHWVLTSVSRADALALIGKDKKIQELQAELFSKELSKRLKKDFGREMDELHDNFGKHGNSTAFLLRKILEKLLIVAFGKNGKEHLLEDPQRPGGYKGLKDMIEVAAREKYRGIPFMTHKTAEATKGIKFLGDTAAHNPKVNVAMNTIVPQMPFIMTAYEELATLL